MLNRNEGLVASVETSLLLRARRVDNRDGANDEHTGMEQTARQNRR